MKDKTLNKRNVQWRRALAALVLLAAFLQPLQQGNQEETRESKERVLRIPVNQAKRWERKSIQV